MYFYPSDEEKWQADIITELAEKHKLSKGVVRQMVYYPLLFLRRTIASDVDEIPVRIRHLGVFNIRPTYGKPTAMKNRAKVLFDNVDSIWDKMPLSKSETGYFESKEHFVKYLNQVVRFRRRAILDRYLEAAKGLV